MTIAICERCDGTGALGTCPDCEGSGAIERLDAFAVATPQPALPLAQTGFVPRPNFCGGRWWHGGVSSPCNAQALPGETFCAPCKARENTLRERRRKDAAAAPAEKGRRRHG